MINEAEFIAAPGQKRVRLDLFLVHHVENATRNKVQRAIDAGSVLVNGAVVRASYQVRPGDVVRVSLPTPQQQDAAPEPIALEIVFEDDRLLVVNKRAGMVTHPAHGNYTGTLVNALLYHCRDLSGVNGPARPGIVHRLDKDTSGLLVVAKDDVAHAHLARQFARRTTTREYWSVVWGRLRGQRGVVEASLGRSKSDRKKMAVVANGKPAATEYIVEESFPYLTLVRLHLRTGRTHQIRVHLAHIQHPVFGDPTYHGRRVHYGPNTPRQRAEVQAMLEVMPRQALHARTLGFVHPGTGRPIEFNSPLPPDFESLLALARRTR
ncbi:MAG: pseudouridine synthase, RluA family [Bacteroidetes bacterium]|nr:pseudouridine synthase, RluA family [Bacteroidota bacterium]